MTIRIVCENETGFDPSTGTFAYCDHTFTCDDSLLAKVTRCPKCQNAIRVGSSHRHVWADTGAPVADPNAVKHHALKQATKAATGAAPKSKSAASPVGGGRDSSSGRQVADAPGRGQTATTKGAAGQQGRAGSAAPREKKIPIKCHNCGTLLAEVQPKCPACLADLSKPAGLSGGTLKTKVPVGFHRWVLAGAFAGVKPLHLAIFLHATVAILTVVLFGFALLSESSNAKTVTAIILGVFVLLYAYVNYACYRACYDLGYPLRWWQRLFWLRILAAARRRNWVDDPTSEYERGVLDLRGKNINDVTLVQVENLTISEVLDIEGCPVSDRGMKALHYLKNLRCLVLVGTGVTAEEVGRLQKSLPNCWIWR